MNASTNRLSPDPDELPLQQAGTFWTSLRYLADGRLIIALLLLIYIPVLGPDTPAAHPFQRTLFIGLTAFYMGFAVLSSIAVRRIRRGFSLQLFAQITVDVLVLGLIVYASNGRSGLGALMITPVAGVAILSATLPALAVAAAASMMLLGETMLRFLQRGDMGTTAIGNELMIAAFISATLFFTALVISRLARRLAMQERLAIRRGEDLRNQRAIHALVVAELDQGVVVFDPRGVPRDMNPKARRLLNLPMGVRREGTVRLRARVLTGGNIPPDELDETAYYPGGDNGQGGRALLDRVVLLEDLKRIEDQAQQLKLASMGRLSASIAHEIRNPLSAIRHAGALLGEQAGTTSQKRLADIIEKNTMRIDRIVEDVLSMARRGALSEVLDLRHFMAQFMPEFLGNVKAGGAVVAGRDGGERIALRHDSHAPITFDPNHLRQILVNLLSNGLRHASEREGAVLLLWTQSAAGVLQLWVLDDGPGIPEDRREHLFEPFFTTETRGTGLGLHLTQELCTANGATIRYESSALLGEDIRQRYGAGFVITPQQRQVAEAGPVAAPSRMESDE